MEDAKVEQTLSAEELEVREAMAKLAAAKQRRADAEAEKVRAAKVAIEERLASEARKRAEELEKYNAIVAEHERREAEKAVIRANEDRRKAAEKLELERRLNAAEEEQRERAARDKRLKDILDAAHQEEQAAIAAEADAIRAAAVDRPVEPPVTLNSAAHPLSFIFGNAPVAHVFEAKPEPPKEEVEIKLRAVSSLEGEVIAQHFQSKLRNRITSNLALPLLQRFEVNIILSAIEVLSDHPTAVSASRDVQAQLLNSVLFHGTENLEQRISDVLEVEAEAARAREEARKGGF